MRKDSYLNASRKGKWKIGKEGERGGKEKREEERGGNRKVRIKRV